MKADQPSTWWVQWQLVRNRPVVFVMHLVYVTAAAYVLPFLPALVVRSLLDRLTGDRPVSFDVTTLLILFVVVGIIRTLFDLFGPLVVTTMRKSAEILMRRNLLHRVLHRPGARALPSSPGEALVRFQHDPESVSLALDFVVDPIGQVFAYVFALTVLARTDAFLTFVVVVPAVLVMFLARAFTPRVVDARRKRQEALGHLTGLLGDAFASVASVQAANAEVRFARRLQQLNEARRRTTLRDVLIDQTVASIGQNIATIATGVVLLLAASRARAGSLSAGDFAVFASYLGSFASVVSLASHLVTYMRQADVSIERMGEVLQDAPTAEVVALEPTYLRGRLPDLPSPPRRSPLEVFEAEGLAFTYPDSQRGIVDVDLEVRRGEVIAITGRIGSGKTTLVRALLGLLPADRGVLRWNGETVTDPGEFLVPPRCAYTSQVPRLFSASLRDNVLLGVDGDVHAAARAAVLDADLSQLDHGWDTMVGPRGVKLSGGQVQRAAAARMFVRDAELLVLDDLSSALDVETEEELWRRLFERPSLTCVVVTHRRAVLRRADRVYVMRDGRIGLPAPAR